RNAQLGNSCPLGNNTYMANASVEISFEGGTVLISASPPDIIKALPGCCIDHRVGAYRAEARHYRAIVEWLRKNDVPYRDGARQYEHVSWTLRTSRDPFPHQTEALEAWCNGNRRGVVVLPTGTGKTHLAIMGIHRVSRPAIVVTP